MDSTLGVRGANQVVRNTAVYLHDVNRDVSLPQSKHHEVRGHVREADGVALERVAFWHSTLDALVELRIAKRCACQLLLHDDTIQANQHHLTSSAEEGRKAEHGCVLSHTQQARGKTRMQDHHPNALTAAGVVGERAQARHNKGTARRHAAYPHGVPLSGNGST